MMLHTKYQGSMPSGFRLKVGFFHVFPIKAYVKHLTPGAGTFLPMWYNLNKLSRGLLGCVTYHISRL